MTYSKKLLLIQVGNKKLSEIQQLCRTLEIQTIIVEPKDFGKPLGQLAKIAGIQGNSATKSPIKTGNSMPPVEMMVFCGLTSEALDTFLAAYRNAGIAPIGLKAIITPSNIRWDVYTLCRELMQEQLQWGK
ncbi:MAG: DUF3783 domain-containing protein [Acetatifactor sp.]|nr:DUF3783 domain-containing protein [Acetatifactor sp.]